MADSAAGQQKAGRDGSHDAQSPKLYQNQDGYLGRQRQLICADDCQPGHADGRRGSKQRVDRRNWPSGRGSEKKQQKGSCQNN